MTPVSLSVSWPERYGGRGLGPEAAAVVSAALGRSEAPDVVNYLALDVVAPGLMEFATEEQLERWLPPMPGASEIWCQMFSEPDAGSDLASLRTTAQIDGDAYVVTGAKVWSTWGQFADRGLALVRTGSAESRHRGITAVVIDMNAPGATVRPLTAMNGVAEFAEVFLSDVVVPVADRVGDHDGGWAVTMAMLAAERGTYPIRRGSVLRAALSRLRRTIDGTTDREVRRAVVDAEIVMRLLDLRIAGMVRRLAAGETLGDDVAATKMILTRAEQSVRSAELAALGVDALAPADNGIVADWLYSRAASIYGGSAQIQRSLIGERVLGLPR
ncbi:MAG: acyl-CoA dehydrogenase family protein [Acidimicrobiales bacterium]|nr:acyl-CoA dehydrogenase family protein [Acidimicrobiales bacterium]